MNFRSLWPPRSRLITTLGVVIDLAACLPFMLPESTAKQARPVSLLILGNAAAVGLVLLLTQGPWRREAACLTLTLVFWMALYSTLSFVRWRGTIERIEWLRVQRIESEK